MRLACVLAHAVGAVEDRHDVPVGGRGGSGAPTCAACRAWRTAVRRRRGFGGLGRAAGRRAALAGARGFGSLRRASSRTAIAAPPACGVGRFGVAPCRRLRLGGALLLLGRACSALRRAASCAPAPRAPSAPWRPSATACGRDIDDVEEDRDQQPQRRHSRQDLGKPRQVPRCVPDERVEQHAREQDRNVDDCRRKLGHDGTPSGIVVVDVWQGELTGTAAPAAIAIAPARTGCRRACQADWAKA